LKVLYFLFLFLLAETSWTQLSDFQKLVVDTRLYENYEISQPYTIPYYWIKADNKCGVIDANQKIVITIAFDDIGPILKKDTCAAFIVKKNGLFGLYSFDGIELLAPKYQYIVPDYYQDSDLLFFAENYRIGVLSLSKGLLLPAENVNISCAANRIYLKMENGEKRIYDLDGKRLLSEFTIETIGFNWFFAGKDINRSRDYWKDWEKKEFYLVKKDSLYGVFNSDLKLVLPLVYSKYELRVRMDTIELKVGRKWTPYFCEPSKTRTEAEFEAWQYSPILGQGYPSDSLMKDMYSKRVYVQILVDFYVNSPQYTPGLNAYLVQRNNLYGILGYYGEVIVPLIYDRLQPFKANRAIVEKAGKYGLINKAGIEVVPTNYDKIEELQLGFFKSTNSNYCIKLNGKYGCADRNGIEIIPPEYEAFNLNFQILEQQYNNAKYYAEYNYPLDPFGNDPFSIGFEYYNLILSDLAKDSNTSYPIENNGALTNSFPTKLNGKWGLISLENELKIPHDYDTLYFLSHDLVFAKKDEKMGVLTIENDIFIPFILDTIYPLKYSPGYNYLYLNPLQLLVYEIGGKKGIFDPVSMKRLAPIYDEIETCWEILDHGIESFFLSEGWPAYHSYKGPGNLNTHDNWQYLRYRIGNQYGLINTFTIEDLTPQRYNQVELIRNKEYLVRLEKKMTFILPLSGTLMLDVFDSVKVINLYYIRSYYDYNDEKSAKMNTYFFTQKDYKWGVFNYQGVCILPMQYEDVLAVQPTSVAGEYEFIVKHKGKYGIVNQDGSVLVPMKYDSIELSQTNDYSCTYKLSKNRNVQLLDSNVLRSNSK
jgi:hypothetical protein